MRKLLFFASIVLCSMAILSSCNKSDEPGGGENGWNNYPAKTDLWELYRGWLDKSPSQIETIMNAKGYEKTTNTPCWYPNGNGGGFSFDFANSLSRRVVCEVSKNIRSFGGCMSYSNGVASLPYSSYSSEIGGTSYSTRDSFLAALGAADKDNLDVSETVVVGQIEYTLCFNIKNGLYEGEAMVVEKQ